MTYLRHAPRHLRRTLIDRVSGRLVDLGWTTTPPLGAQPLQILTRRVRESEQIPAEANMVGIYFGEETDEAEVELGGGLSSVTTRMVCDVIAANDTYGLAISSDIKDCLTGRAPGFSRVFRLRDYTTDQAGVPRDDHMIEILEVTRARPEQTEARMWWQVVVAQVELVMAGGDS